MAKCKLHPSRASGAEFLRATGKREADFVKDCNGLKLLLDRSWFERVWIYRKLLAHESPKLFAALNQCQHACLLSLHLC